MSRKRDFNSCEESPEESPETPVRGNNDSELELSQSPAAKRAKRSGRPNAASIIAFETPTSGGGKSKKKNMNKNRSKRVKIAHGEGVEDVGNGEEEENVYDVPETFTPGGVFGIKTRRLSIIGPNTPYSERIARLKKEQLEKRKSLETFTANNTPATLSKSGGEGSKIKNDGHDGGVGKRVDGEADAMDVDGATTNDKGNGKEAETNGVNGEKKSKKKRKDASTAKKNKKRKLTFNVETGQEEERLLTGKEMEEIFPDLTKPVVAGGGEKGGEGEEGGNTWGEIEEQQITRELPTDFTTTGNPLSSSQKHTSAPMELDNLDFGVQDDDEADDGGNDKEEIRGLIEEIFEQPQFLYQADEGGKGKGKGEEKEKAAGAAHPVFLREVQGLMETDSQYTQTLRGESIGNNDDDDDGHNDRDDLATIKSLLRALETKIDALPSDGQGQQDKMKSLAKEMHEVFEGMVRLSGRVRRDEMRAGIRHEILFNGMKKIVRELGAVRRQGEAVMEYLGLQTESPQGPSRKKWEEKDVNKEGRKALESCLRFHLDDMGRATGKEQLEEKGRLAVEYAGRVLGG